MDVAPVGEIYMPAVQAFELIALLIWMLTWQVCGGNNRLSIRVFVAKLRCSPRHLGPPAMLRDLPY